MMDKVYERTENGVAAIVSRKSGMDEINHAMMAGKRDVRTMSSITRTDFAIEYKNGRSVRLVLVDETAPEGFAQGQAVVVQRPGRAPLTGTVAHIHTAPGYVAVLDDRNRAVSNYPTSFVSPAEADGEPEADEFDGHVISVRGGKVHTAMPGAPEGRAYPLCRGGGMNQMLTKFTATTAPLSCKTCMTYAERRQMFGTA
ncbi:hypothetical protein ABZ445_16355 [Streptomyces chartreusis]|uniref:hypothetical protein n=1 Tax=Streptomyces chartreusis TaxID=1969 RepID=UPI00340FB6D0